MKAYRIQVCSDVDYENLIAEVYVEGKFVALVSREDLSQGFCVEFPGPEQHEPAISRRVDLLTLLEALDEAKAQLAGKQ